MLFNSYTSILSLSIARESIITLFDLVLNASSAACLPVINATIVRVYSIFFSKKNKELLDQSINKYIALLDPYISKVTKKFLEVGYYTGISLYYSLLGYGVEINFIIREISPLSEEGDTIGSISTSSVTGANEVVLNEMFPKVCDFAMKIYKIVAKRFRDLNILPFIYTFLAFMWHMSKFPAAIE
ncbi:unnamed protein product [Clonostachys solani]|uniref:Uncharacterized protein n=1 Tax=Clonostachys solani TaxID=160281 RepID=A0A9N9ZD87_9HYPO|nr:unnamed protein product [Clonostachys solani]